jgi:SAM-dependent methyltransferase
VKFPPILHFLGWIGVGLAVWWWLASIAASWWIYDHSPLMDWKWVEKFSANPKPRWANLHSGLDESTPALTRLWGAPDAVLDFFDPAQMTEASILRARRLLGIPEAGQSVSFSDLPVTTGSLDVACVIFSAHELRAEPLREKFFRELYRAIKTGGRLVVVEHLRNVPNFLVFGPGFMHFFSRKSWLEIGRRADFRLVQETKMTPFVSAFVWEK